MNVEEFILSGMIVLCHGSCPHELFYTSLLYLSKNNLVFHFQTLYIFAMLFNQMFRGDTNHGVEWEWELDFL